MAESAVVGIDACSSGWVGVAIRDGEAWCAVARDFASVVRSIESAREVRVIGVDIPIGVPESSSRAADRLARQAIGRRSGSVFTTPTRRALEAADHKTASAINRELTGKGISIQSYGMRHRIVEVEAWIAAHPGADVIEVHPEVSFAEMARQPLDFTKHSWSGLEERRLLLTAQGIDLTGRMGDAGGRAGADDVLDAAAVAWSARRYLLGQARSLPDPPESIDGTLAAIWV